MLCELRELRVLYLHANAIFIMSEVYVLGALPHLHTITLHGNVVETEQGYRCGFTLLLDLWTAAMLLFSVQQNVMPPCRCHLQVSRHLRAAAAEMHGLQRRDAPGASHGPVLAPGSPVQEARRGPRRLLAACQPRTREEGPSKDADLKHQQGATAEEVCSDG